MPDMKVRVHFSPIRFQFKLLTKQRVHLAILTVLIFGVVSIPSRAIQGFGWPPGFQEVVSVSVRDMNGSMIMSG